MKNKSDENIALWVVATPIGHLDDNSIRCQQVLAEVDQILAEDTRHSRRLLEHYSIRQSVSSLHDHNEAHRVEGIIEQMQAGKKFALISDAGTPLISDPGYRLVRACGDAGLRVSTVPGACAAVAALSVSGLPSDEFYFAGFLPARPAQKTKQLQEFSGASASLIFYESPQRVLATLQAMQQVFGADREACLCRELTKQFETVVRLPLGRLTEFVASDSNQQRGEIVLVVEGAPAASEVTITAQQRELYLQLAQYMPPGKLAGIMARYWSLPRKQLYDLAGD